MCSSDLSLTEVRSQYDWYYSADVVYVYGASNPAILFASQGVEIPAREDGINLNGQSHIVISNISVYGANTSNIEIGASSNVAVLGHPDEMFLSAGGYFNVHSNGPDSQTEVVIDGIESDHAGSAGISLNVPTPNVNSNYYTIRRVRSFRDGIVSYTFEESGDYSNVYKFPAAIHLYGLRGVQVQWNCIQDTGFRDDGVVPNAGVANAVQGNGIWLDTDRGSAVALADGGSMVAYNIVQHLAQSGLFNEQSAYNTWAYNVANEACQSVTGTGGTGCAGLEMNMSTGTGNNLIGNQFFNNTVYGSGNAGIENEGDFAGVPNCDLNNIYENNISVGNSGPNLTASFGGDNQSGLGSGNVYSSNSFGPGSNGFIIWDFISFNSYSAWAATFGDYPSMQLDPLLSNPSTGDFRLAEASPARQDGTPISGFPFPYARPDLGAIPYYAKAANTLTF